MNMSTYIYIILVIGLVLHYILKRKRTYDKWYAYTYINTERAKQFFPSPIYKYLYAIKTGKIKLVTPSKLEVKYQWEKWKKAQGSF